MKRLLCLGLLGTFALALPACLACNDIGCAGGFSWSAEADDASALAPGAYAVTIVVEEDTYTVDCQIAETVEDSECSLPEHVDGSVDYSIDFGIDQLASDDWDPQQPVGGFNMRAVDDTGSEPDGSYSENRGPTHVEILIAGETETLLMDSFDLSYERDEEYRGDARCGFCDEEEIRDSTWVGHEA